MPNIIQVVNKNQSRATGAPPADFGEQKRILKSTLREAGFSVEPPTRDEVKEEGGDTKQVADLKRQLTIEKNKHSGDRGGGRGGGRGSRGGGRGGGATATSTFRVNRLGRPVFDRKDAVVTDGKVRSKNKDNQNRLMKILPCPGCLCGILAREVPRGEQAGLHEGQPGNVAQSTTGTAGKATPNASCVSVLGREEHEPADPLPEEQEGTRAWEELPLVAGLEGERKTTTAQNAHP